MSTTSPLSFVVLLALVFVALALVFPLGQVEARSYGIRSLSTDNANCMLLQNLQSGSPLGDDRTPLVIGATDLYYAGDAKIGRINATTLTLSSSSSTQVDGLFSDLSDGTFWTFGTSESTRYSFDVDADSWDYEQSDITHLIPLYTSDAGVLELDESRSVVALSQPLNPTYQQPGVFQGMGEFIFTSRIAAPSDKAGVFHVSISTGQVTRVFNPTTADEAWTTVPGLEYTENWARWGVMERHGDKLYIVGIVSSDGDTKGVYRYNLDGTLNSKIYEGDLNDAAVFAVTYFHLGSGTTPRWYTHGEGGPSNTDFEGSDTWKEWILSCQADLFYSESSASSVPCAVCSLWATLFA